nr:uncharacterized protein LOC109181809 isoform X1 [Ipomoea trifida]
MRFLAAVLMLWMIGSAHSSDETISYGCNAESYREGSGFGSSLGYVFVDLVNSTPVSLGFDLYDVSPPTTGGPPVYGHGRCLNSMSAAECFSCLGRAKDIVSVCCDLRIGALILSSSPARSAENSGAISYQCNVQEYTQESRFGASLDYVFTDLIRSTPTIAGFNLYVVSPPATGGPPVYGNARCMYGMTASDCASCLRRAKRLVKSICPSRIGGWVFTGVRAALFQLRPRLVRLFEGLFDVAGDHGVHFRPAVSSQENKLGFLKSKKTTTLYMYNVLFACLILFPALAIQSGGTSSDCSKDSAMGNCLNTSSSLSAFDSSVKNIISLLINNAFKLPSPLPPWPKGVDFAKGIIDLGGLQVAQVSNFTKVWSTGEGGPGDSGATFFEPSAIPDGFFMLGTYAQPNNMPLYGWVLVGKDVTGNTTGGSLKKPTDYDLVWSSEGNAKAKQDSPGYIWVPKPAEGYEAVGYVVTASPQKPSVDRIRCVRSDFTNVSEIQDLIWGVDGFNVYSARPKDRGIQAPGVPTGAFVAQTNPNSSVLLPCLKNSNKNLSAMPSSSQIEALMKAYGPMVYFHPNEAFFPSSVAWFFQNGALLYTKGNESRGVAVDPSGSNLPQGGSNDGGYWLDLPTSDPERVKKGNIQNASAYVHVKPMLGGTFTDMAVWLFYPFNGAAKAKLEFVTLPLGKIGEHVGDWEHVTLRISNFNGELKSVYFSEHSRGIWVSASQLEYLNGTNKPVVYSSLHGHAAYSSPGQNLQGSGDIGIRNDTAKGGMSMDTGLKFSVVSAEYLGKDIVEPPWLNYAREWGPKISYDIGKELKKIARFMPGKVKSALEKLVKDLPSEVLGEEGPTGPKWKDNWSGDERS